MLIPNENYIFVIPKENQENDSKKRLIMDAESAGRHINLKVGEVFYDTGKTSDLIAVRHELGQHIIYQSIGVEKLEYTRKKMTSPTGSQKPVAIDEVFSLELIPVSSIVGMFDPTNSSLVFKK